MKLGVMISGDLGLTALRYLFKNHDIKFALTDFKSKKIINFCNKNKLDVFVGNPRKGRALSFCATKKINVLISVNYLFIIEKDLIELPKDLAFNIHGSLLPKYRGRTPHVWAIINNESKTGVTAHKIEEGCDTGDIIEQIAVKINKNDTGAELLKKYKKKYVILLSKVLQKVNLNKLTFTKQQNSLSTVFPKRTPVDGKINWNWQKERIYNWIRAQAYPYPGAFTILGGKKIIIDKIKYSEIGYKNEIANGQLLSLKPLLVKTPNGVVELLKIRKHDCEILKNSIFE